MKMILKSFLTILSWGMCFHFASGQTDVSCPSSEECYRTPNGCTSSADCDAIIFYQYNSNNEELEITIGTRLKWVGFTQVPTLGGAKMSNIRGEACYNLNSNAKLVNLDATGNTAPTYRALNLVEGITLTEAILTTTGGVVCRYRRLVTPPAASSSFYYNLNLPHHIVYAYGENVGSEFPSYHGGGKTGSTPNGITFLPTEVSCPSSEECYRTPNGCTSSADCDAIIYYQYNSNNEELEITIGTRLKWVGFTQVPTLGGAKMSNIRGEACYNLNSNAKLVNLDATGNTAPTYRALNLVEGITLTEAILTTTGGVVCRYRRLVTPPAASSSFYYNLNLPHHIVYAYGENVGSEFPSYHGGGKTGSTPNPITFLPISGTQLPSSHTPSETGFTQNAITSPPEVADVSCPSSEGCYRTPNGCTSSADCDAIIFYQYNSNNEELEITIGTRLKWVGFTQVPTLGGAKMSNIRGEACYNLNSNAKLVNLDATGNTAPTYRALNLVEGITLTEAILTTTGGVVCRYRRLVTPPAASSSFYYNLNLPHHIVYAYGENVGSEFPSYHGGGKTGSTPNPITFLPISGTQLPSSHTPSETGFTQNAITSPPFSGTQLPSSHTPSETGFTQNAITSPPFSGTQLPSSHTPSEIGFTQNAFTSPPFSGTQLPSSHTPSETGFTQTAITSPPEVADVSCPSSEGCYRTPNGCTSSADCDAIIFYQYNSNNEELEITIGTRLKWVGFTQVPTLGGEKMSNIRGEACYNLNSNAKLVNLDATSNTGPTYRALNLVEGITLTKAILTTTGGVICRYRRLVTPPAASISFYYDLTLPHHIVYAYGENVGSEFPSYHTPGKTGSTPNRITFLPISGTQLPSSHTPSETGFTQNAITTLPEVADVSCPSSEGCYRTPNGCTSSADCDAIIFYQYNSNNEELEITIGTRLKWVGFTQVPTLGGAKMSNIRGEACYNLNSNAKLVNLDATGNTAPTYRALNLVEGITLTEAILTTTGGVVCRYRRLVTPPAASSSFYYDLTLPHHIVYAYGENIGSEFPSYHGGGKTGSTPNRITFLHISGTQLPSSHTPSETGFTQNAITSPPETSTVNLNGCGTSFTCQRMPEGCSPPSACDALAIFTYQTSASTIDIELITKTNWVGLGQKTSSEGNRMVDIRGQYCLRRGSNVKFGHFNGNSLSVATTPAWIDSVAGVSLISSEIRSDGTISCKFRRPVEPAANNNNLYSLRNTVQSIIAYGDGESGGNPNYHGRGSYSSANDVNYLVSAVISEDAVDLEVGIKAHGILMIIAWMLLATCGIYMPRYMKPVLKDRKICGKAAWFPVHQITMLLCVATFIVGFIVILVHLDGKWSETAEAHHWLGLFTIITGLLQPVMTVFRPNPDSEKRPIFNWVHRLVGMTAWLLGGLSIVYGLDLADQEYTPAIVLIVAAIVLYLALDLALIAKRMKQSSVAVSYTPHKGVTAVENQKTGDEQKGSNLQWLFLILVFALSFVMTIYHIYLVATAETGGSS